MGCKSYKNSNTGNVLKFSDPGLLCFVKNFQQAICARNFRTFIISLRTLIFSFVNQTYILGFIKEVLKILTAQNILKMMD